MKNTITILALAATAAATGFRDAPAFSCPGNTDNHCTDKQLGGFNFNDLGFGAFSSYNNFDFKGWTCGSDNSKRFAPRTGGNKISGVCGHTKEQSPSFGCGSGDKFSLGGVHVKPEFDCDLEFHYEMPGGSTCKHRTSCSKSGTDVKNDQCGGATSVTVVYPPQPTHTKTTCSVEIHSMTFDCGSSSTKPPKTTATKGSSTKATTTSVQTTTTSTKDIETTPTTTPIVKTSPPATTSPPVTTSPPFGNGTTSVTTSESIKETTSESIKETTSETVTQETSTFVTSFLTTSTVFTTSTSTITSCAKTITDCPAGGVTTTVVTVAVSTTVCPVTETRTTVQSNTQTTAESTVTGTTSNVGLTTTTTSTKPVETLPCPNVVPQCLNTFLFSVGCSDNSDSACYCPDEIFVKNIFDCIYAHGESAQVVSEAVIFFQGICAPYVPTNPAIATGATVTSYVTASATPVTTSLAPVYTTVTVEATTVVPCTNSAGSTIPSSSVTVVVTTAITVPNVAFTTGTGSSNAVGLVPATVTATTAAAVTGGSKATTTAATLITAPAGTGGLTAKPSSTGLVTVSSSHRVSAGFGLALAVMAFLAAL